jgi:hypothetical protein
VSNEWFTPARYIEAARLVLGGIDLDPASCAEANQTVKATRYFTEADNGLMQHWSGHVWLNPPYGRTTQGQGSYLEQFTRKMLLAYEGGLVSAGMMLIPVNTATSWFTPLWQYPICFPAKRIDFVGSCDRRGGRVSFGTCFVYLGPSVAQFIEVFGKFGTIAQQVRKTSVIVPSELWEVSA